MPKVWNYKYVGLFLPILILLALMTYPMVIVQFGETILLETVPYDPTDLFRGDYVELSYQVSELDESYLHESIQITEADMYDNHVYYAVLKPSGKVHVVDYLTDNKPSEHAFSDNEDQVWKGSQLDNHNKLLSAKQERRHPEHKRQNQGDYRGQRPNPKGKPC